MQRSGSHRGKLPNVVFSLTALAVIAADQLSKLWIRSNLITGESIPERGLFQLTYVRNTGSAFGLFQGQSFPLTIIAFMGVVMLLFFALFVYRRPPFSDGDLGKLALGLVLGGTAGNLIDRLRFGYVTDFLDIGIWPAFNLADSAIVIGVILFSYTLYSLNTAREG